MTDINYRKSKTVDALDMTDFFAENISYLAIVVVLMLTGTGLPIPEEIPIVFAGWAAATGILNPWLAFACCILGAVLGDCIIYSIGYHFGHNLRSHRGLARFLHAEREAQVERMIDKHGLKVFFVARFLVGLRSSVYLAAGIMRVPFRKFILIDGICATLVISIFFWLAFHFAEEIERLMKWIRGAEATLTVVVVLAIVAVVFIYWRRRRRRWARVLKRRLRQKLAAAETSRDAEPVSRVAADTKQHDAATS